MPRHPGPLGAMLSEHEQARLLLSKLDPLGRALAAGDTAALPELRATFEAYAALCKDHFWKEGDVLYPAALRMLREDEGAEIVQGIEELEAAIGEGTRERYYRMAQEIVEEQRAVVRLFGLAATHLLLEPD